jgi:hypothetical protein
VVAALVAMKEVIGGFDAGEDSWLDYPALGRPGSGIALTSGGRSVMISGIHPEDPRDLAP